MKQIYKKFLTGSLANNRTYWLL